MRPPSTQPSPISRWERSEKGVAPSSTAPSPAGGRGSSGVAISVSLPRTLNPVTLGAPRPREGRACRAPSSASARSESKNCRVGLRVLHLVQQEFDRGESGRASVHRVQELAQELPSAHLPRSWRAHPVAVMSTNLIFPAHPAPLPQAGEGRSRQRLALALFTLAPSPLWGEGRGEGLPTASSNRRIPRWSSCPSSCPAGIRPRRARPSGAGACAGSRSWRAHPAR